MVHGSERSALMSYATKLGREIRFELAEWAYETKNNINIRTKKENLGEKSRSPYACRTEENQKALIPNTCRTSLVKRKESSTGRRSNSASSDGSEYQPSIGMPFAAVSVTLGMRYMRARLAYTKQNKRTLVYTVTCW